VKSLQLLLRNKHKIILSCVLFNLVLEYWVHGILFFLNPTRIFLVLLYLTYFMMLEDLILRFHLKDYQVWLFAVTFWVFYDAFIAGTIFGTGTFLGIDLFTFVMINLVWWGIIQAVLTMYFANRFIASRDWTDPRMGRLGWILAISYYVLMFLGGTLFDPNQPKGTLLGNITSAIIVLTGIISFYVSFRITSKESSDETLEKHKILDVLIIITIVLSLILGTFMFGSQTAQELSVYWSIVVCIVFVVYRALIRKCVPV